MKTAFKVLLMWIGIALFSLITNLVISSCDDTSQKKSDEPTTKKPQTEGIIDGSSGYYSIGAVDYQKSGMKYTLFSTGNGDLFVVNVTKDNLECLKYRLMIIVKDFIKN